MGNETITVFLDQSELSDSEEMWALRQNEVSAAWKEVRGWRVLAAAQGGGAQGHSWLAQDPDDRQESAGDQ